MERVQAEDFYDKTHQMIYEVMVRSGRQSTDRSGDPYISLQDKGQLEEVGGVSYLAKLAHAVPTRTWIITPRSSKRNRCGG